MRYNLLIADDEELIRKGLIARLEYLEFEFETISETSSGKEALEICKTIPIDIVITDIRMPDMDGLTLISKAKEIYPLMKFIILSGYAEFSYAEHAISLGVKGYLLKPLSNGELKTVVAKTMELIEEERRIQTTVKSQERLKKEQYEYTLEKQINSIISNKQLDEKSEQSHYNFLKEEVPWLFMDQGRKQFLGIINIDGKSYEKGRFRHGDIDLIRFSMKNVFREIESSCDMIIVNNLSDYNQMYALFSFEREKVLRNEVERVFLKVKNIFEKRMDIYLTFGISKSANRLSTSSRKEAKEALDQRMVYGTSNIYFHQDVVMFTANQLPTSELNMLGYYMERNDIKNIQAVIHEIFQEDVAVKYNSTYIRVIWTRILTMILCNFDSKGHNTTGKMKEIMDSFDLLDEVHSIKELEKRLIDLILGCLQGEDLMDINARNKINLAIQYINENYAKNIAINELAERYDMSHNYFSSTFKKEFKQSTVSYITDLRIKKSMEYLIASEGSVMDIARKVGYEDSQYFFRVFKKSTGMTPLQYRQKEKREKSS